MSQAEIDSIRTFLAEAIDQKSKEVVGMAARQFGVSRQTIHRHLAEMVSEGILAATGRTRGRTYSLRTLPGNDQRFQISEQLAEDKVWRECFAGLLSELPDNVRQLCNYGFTEMFNNAIEHSSGTTIEARLDRTYVRSTLSVFDDGIGIFKKIKDGLNLADEREAILELAKGKVTTDPAGHSGEGVFFTSRMFDSFSLLANGLFFCHAASREDWLIETRPESMSGTLVSMEIASATARTQSEVFNKYSSNGEVPRFDKTHVPVKLLLVGKENLVSRSQAKRLLTRFARFREVMLDFDGVSHIGQAFADEIFRVYKTQHPDIRIVPLRANDDVQAMIAWVSSQKEASE